MLLKTKVIAKFVHQLVVEFLPIISDDVTGYTIPEDDIPFDEVHTVSFFTSRNTAASAHLEK